MFSWIPMYTELATKILPFRNRQSELIQLLKELGAEGIPAGSTFDKDDKGAKIPLTSIDPFTFYTCFNLASQKRTDARYSPISKRSCSYSQRFTQISMVFQS
jgi:hypothetical protein